MSRAIQFESEAITEATVDSSHTVQENQFGASEAQLDEALERELSANNSTTSSHIRDSLRDLQDELTAAAGAVTPQNERQQAQQDVSSGGNTRLRSLENELMQLDHQEEQERESRLHKYRKGLAFFLGGFFRIDINHPVSQAFIATIILINAVFIGVETDYRTRNVEPWSEEWTPWFIVETLFLVIFIIELGLRFRLLGCRKAGYDYWNLFDLFLVVLGAIDSWILQFTIKDTGGSLVRLVRLVRLLRVLRIIRLFRFFKELTLLAQGILGALQAMSWAALLIIVVLYVSAVIMTNTLGRVSDSEVALWFGSLGSSLFTLFQLMTLQDWPEVVRGSMKHEKFVWLFFVPFMMFTNFAMLNVITAVVVEKVFTIARAEAAEEARRAEKKRTAMLRKIKLLFKVIDKDGNAELELDEFREALKLPAVVQQFMELGIAKYEADDLFACLDVDGNESISVAEFVEGVLRVHGPAQSKHLLQVQYDILRSKEALQQDLNELGWYVRWVIRHLSYRYDWRRKDDNEFSHNHRERVSPKASSSANPSALPAASDPVAANEKPSSDKNAEEPGSPKSVSSKKSKVKLSAESVENVDVPKSLPEVKKPLEMKNPPERICEEVKSSPVGNLAEVKGRADVEVREQLPGTITLLPLALDQEAAGGLDETPSALPKMHAVGTPPLAVATPPRATPPQTERDAVDQDTSAGNARAGATAAERPAGSAEATTRLLNEATARLLRHSVGAGPLEDRFAVTPSPQPPSTGKVPQQLADNEADVAISMLRGIRADQKTMLGAMQDLLKEVRGIREQFMELSGDRKSVV